MINNKKSIVHYSNYSFNMLFMLISYSIAYLSNFFLDIFTSWIGGPALLGTVNLTRKWALIIATILELGIVSTIPKFIAENRKGNFIKISVIILILDTFTCLTSGILLYFLYPFNNFLIIEFGLISASSKIFYGLFYSISRGRERIKQMIYLQFSLATIRSISFIVLIIVGFDLFLVILLSFAIIPIIAILLIFPFMNFKQLLSKNPKIMNNNKLSFTSYLKFTMPVYGSTIIAIVASQMDIIFIGFFFTPNEFGLYLVAVSITGILSVINNAVNILLLPKISKISNDKSKVISLMNQSLKFFFLIYIPISLIILFYPDIIIHFLYGPGYSAATFISMRILIISSIFTQISSIFIEFFIALNRPSYKLYGLILLLISKFSFLSIFIPINGIYGISLAVILSELIQFTFLFILFKKLLKQKYSNNKIYFKRLDFRFWILSITISSIIFGSGLFIPNYFFKLLIIVGGLLIIFIFYLFTGKLFFLSNLFRNGIQKYSTQRTQIISSRIHYILSKLPHKIPVILDDGCGRGNITLELAKYYYIVAIEPIAKNFKNNLKLKRKNLMPNFIVGSGENLPFKNNTFDFILSQMVLEHCDSSEKYIKETSRILKNQGFLYISIPNRLFPIEPHTKLPFISYLSVEFHPYLRKLVNFQFTFPRIINLLNSFYNKVYDINLFILKNKFYYANYFLLFYISHNFKYIKFFYPLIKFIIPSWAFLIKK